MLVSILFMLFINKELLLVIFSFSILENFQNLNQNLFETIIYNCPVELLLTYFSLFFYCSLFVSFPYLLWSLYDFFKGAFYSSNLKLIKFIIFFLLCY